MASSANEGDMSCGNSDVPQIVTKAASSAVSLANAFAASSATASSFVEIAASTASKQSAVMRDAHVIYEVNVPDVQESVASLSNDVFQHILSTIAKTDAHQLSDDLRMALINSCFEVLQQYASRKKDALTTIIPEISAVITAVKSAPDSEWLLECSYSQLPRNIVLEHVRPLFVDALCSAHDSLAKRATALC